MNYLLSVIEEIIKNCSVFRSSYRNPSESLGEQEMLWEHEPLWESVSTAFLSYSPILPPPWAERGETLV